MNMFKKSYYMEDFYKQDDVFVKIAENGFATKVLYISHDAPGIVKYFFIPK